MSDPDLDDYADPDDVFDDVLADLFWAVVVPGLIVYFVYLGA